MLQFDSENVFEILLPLMRIFLEMILLEFKNLKYLKISVYIFMLYGDFNKLKYLIVTLYFIVFLLL